MYLNINPLFILVFLLILFAWNARPLVGTRHNRQLRFKSSVNSVKVGTASSPKLSSNVLIFFCGAISMVCGGMDCVVVVIWVILVISNFFVTSC